ncbi:hypothetical protein [Pseudonocardia xishanensis]|uniref:Uncharacterized protein n=1 Tax=Pseudonocardia xishanensis TaxID=630995 RepID=A0ABP8RWS7_9PSEU
MTGRVRGPLGLAVPFEITAHDESARTWAWDAHFGPITLSLDHGIETHGSGSRTWPAVDGPAPALALYLPLARISIELLVRRRP